MIFIRYPLFFIVGAVLFLTVLAIPKNTAEPLDGVALISGIFAEKSGGEYYIVAVGEGAEDNDGFTASGHGDSIASAVENADKNSSKTLYFGTLGVAVIGDGCESDFAKYVLARREIPLNIPVLISDSPKSYADVCGELTQKAGKTGVPSRLSALINSVYSDCPAELLHIYEREDVIFLER